MRVWWWWWWWWWGMHTHPPDREGSGCVAMLPLIPYDPRWFRSSCSFTAGHFSCSESTFNAPLLILSMMYGPG